MTITLRRDYQMVIFKWDESLENYEIVTGGIEFEDVEDITDRMQLVGAHEGCDYKGWETEIN